MQVEVGETPSLTREFAGETQSVLECTQTHPPRNQQQRSPICIWVAEKVTESRPSARQVVWFPLGPLPHIQLHKAATWMAPPWQTPKVHPLLSNRNSKTKKKMAQMKEQIKSKN